MGVNNVMLNELHHHVGAEKYCSYCGLRWDDPIHNLGVPVRSRFWGSVTYFVATFTTSAAAVYNLFGDRWDRATFFLILTLELLRLWRNYESRQE